MLFKNLSSFLSALEKEELPFYLLISKESKKIPFEAMRFDPEHFSLRHFEEEVMSYSLWPGPRKFYLPNIEKLSESDVAGIALALEKSCPHSTFLFTATKMPNKAFVKVIEEKGGLLVLEEEKKWEKMRRLEAKIRSSLSIDEEGIKALLQKVGGNEERMVQEIEKLSCFSKIGLQEINDLVPNQLDATLWDFEEALLQKRRDSALNRGEALLEEGFSLFALFSYLRTQLREKLELLEGETSSLKPFQMKKREVALSIGAKKLKKTIIYLFEYEYVAKTSERDEKSLLERFILEVTA